MHDFTADRLAEHRNAPVYDSSGEQIGHVGEIWYDETTGRAEWLKIGTGFLGMKNLFVPVEGGRFEGDGFHVNYTRDQIESSPELKGDEWTDDYETELRSSYGLGERGSRTTCRATSARRPARPPRTSPRRAAPRP